MFSSFIFRRHGRRCEVITSVFIFQFFEQYDESEIGALDFDNIDGNVDDKCEQMNKLIKDYQDSKAEG